MRSGFFATLAAVVDVLPVIASLLAAASSLAAPPRGIRQHEQVQAGEQEQGEREQRHEAHPDGRLLLHHGDDVDDDSRRKGNGQPAVNLSNRLIPIQWDLLSTRAERITRPAWRRTQSNRPGPTSRFAKNSPHPPWAPP